MQDLQHLLDYIEERIDLDHCAEVDDRYKRALSFEPIDKPPLVISCDEPVSDFTPFPYSEAFYDPAKMMFNQLLERVALGVILRDDSPLAIRSDHGIIQVGSLLGAKWQLTEDNYPWVEHLESREQLELIASGQTPIDLEAGGIVGPSIQTLQFYHQVLAEYPLCRKAIQISMPDLQGPMDTAHLLWGNDIFYAFYDEQELLSAVLDSVVSAMLALEKKYRPLTRDHMDPFGTTQHTYVVPGRLLIRDDTSIMVSSEIYKNFVRPYNSHILKEVGKGSIHLCGNAEHLIDAILDTSNLVGVDLSQPELMNIADVYRKCAARRIPITHFSRQAQDLTTGRAAEMFPTGVVFVHQAQTFEEAKDVAKAYFGK